MRLRLLSTLLALTLLPPLNAASAYAVGSATSATSQQNEADEAETLALEKALVELAGRRREVEALKVALKAKDEHAAALEKLVAEQERLIAEWKTAASARREANDVDARIRASYEESVRKYEDELRRVREERDSARRSRWTWAFGGAVLGAVIAVLASKD